MKPENTESIDSIETPAVIIDDSVVNRNIALFQAYCTKNGLALRPHIKTHKLPVYAHKQLDAGAIGITCQKISEAEVMANAGLDNILITYNILGAEKLQRLLMLHLGIKRLQVVADSREVIDGLSNVFSPQQKNLPVLVECDTGAERCGVQSPAAAVELAQHIVASKGLDFGGLMTYPPVGDGAAVATFIRECRKQLDSAGIHCPVVSSGGSPDMWQAGTVSGIDEYRIGTYIYNDRSLVERGTCSYDDCALIVLATVVSTPAPGRAIIDAGSKCLTSDLLGLDGYGHVLGYNQVSISSLSEEHGNLTWQDTNQQHFFVGQRIHVVPNHVCVVSNMFDTVWIKNQESALVPHKVSARGCVI